ncbi:MAG: hypothetical protein Q4E10_02515 [Porphyromonas sp.]|nr:hypothetical protein [Porphyromonas sp.]
MILGGGLTLSAQEVVIKGSVLTMKGEPLEGAMVSLKALPDSTFVSYCVTDQSGAFVLSSHEQLSRVLIEVRHGFINPVSKVLPYKSQILDLRVEESDYFKLDEVIVHPEAILEKGDTLTYLTSAFVTENTQNLREALEKMPGIQVSESGTVSYNGKSISEFQIEGMDLFDGKYGIAMERIRPEDIASVQVMRNFQPLKVLQESRPKDDVALNLILKDHAKSLFSLENSTKTGIEERNRWLYDQGVTASLFNARHQSFAVIDADNAGKNPIRTYTDHIMRYMGGESLIEVSKPSLPAVSEKQYRDNRSFAISYNGASKPGEESKLKYSALYIGDRNWSNYLREKSYRLPDGSTAVHSYMGSNREQTHLGEAAFHFDINRKDYYLSDKLVTRVERSLPYALLEGSVEGKEQGKEATGALYNSFRIIKRFDDVRGIDFRLDASYQDKNGELQLLPLKGAESGFLQRIDSRYLALDARFEMLSTIRWGDLVIDPYGFMTWDRSMLQSNLNGSLLPELPSVGEVDYGLYRLGAGLSLHYAIGRWRLEGYLPLMYWSVRVRRPDHPLGKSLVRFEPNLSVKTTIVPHLTASVSGRLTNSFNPAEDFLQAVVLRNSHEIRYAETDRIAEKRQMGLDSHLEYILPHERLSATLFLRYNNLYSDMITHLRVGEGHIEASLVPHQNNSHITSVGGDFSKGFVKNRGLLALGGSYSDFRSQAMTDGAITPFATRSYRLYLRGSVRPLEWLEMEARTDWNSLQSRQEGNPAPFDQKLLYLQGAVSIRLLKGLTLELSEVYSRTFAPFKSSAHLTDIAMRYTLGRTIISIDLNNLTNEQAYETYIVGSNVADYSYYRLRPRSIMLGVRWNIH